MHTTASTPRVSATLYRLADWFHRRQPKHGLTLPAVGQGSLATLAQANGRAQTAAPAALSGAAAPVKPRPLRVLRIVDSQARPSVGRLVISGRMADVCAELDRLALKDAAMA